jgi:class 3 adenylate cyclase
VVPQPDIRYVRNAHGDYLAYQVLGEGPRDLVFVPEWISNIEVAWEAPAFLGALQRLASFSRVIWFDKLGTGLSDPLPPTAMPTLESWIDDVLAVTDAVRSRSAAVLGTGFGAMMAVVYAASHPERVDRLALVNPFTCPARRDDYRPGMPPAVQEWVLRNVAEAWGRGAFADVMAPNLDAAWFARYQRAAVSPGVALELTRAFFETDVRKVLPVLDTPTLVVHREGDRWARVGHGRYLARHVRGARYSELPGAAHFFEGEEDPALDEIEVFLTGSRRSPESNRILATVLFADIVDSTALAAELGDDGWRRRLQQYYALARRETDRFRGREISTSGDGYFAAFDGPARAVRAAGALRDAVCTLGMRLRAGLHTGECERIGNDLAGIAVHLGARVAERAAPGEVLVSSTVKDLVAGSGLRFSERGEETLKGIPGQWRLFRVEGQG